MFQTPLSHLLAFFSLVAGGAVVIVGFLIYVLVSLLRQRQLIRLADQEQVNQDEKKRSG